MDYLALYVGHQSHTGPAGNEKPSVDKNLAIGAASVLGTGIRLPGSVSHGTPDVAKSLTLSLWLQINKSYFFL